MDGQITRRNWLRSLPAAMIASRLSAQAGRRPIPVKSLSHMTLTVSDLKRSLDFYQGLFGMTIQHRQDTTTGLRIGSGTQYVSLGGGGADAKPRINHFCMTVENFNAERILRTLAGHGIQKSDVPGADGSRSGGALKSWVRMRGEAAGGAKEGTPELYVGDPDGIMVQLQDTSYCGGGGVLGNICRPISQPAPPKALLPIRDISHFTLSVSNSQRSTEFYQELFGMQVQAHQGATPLLAVGSGRQFLTMAGGAANSTIPRIPSIGHACFRMEGFNVDRVLKTLADYGVTPRGDARGPAPPLKSYVSMRMEDRGGAKGGTPEVYFTDPDGILLQIQDISYCGGSGYLGDVCG